MRTKLAIAALLLIGAILWIALRSSSQDSSLSQKAPEEEQGLSTSSQGAKSSDPSSGSLKNQGSSLVLDTTNKDPNFHRFTDGTVHFLGPIATSRTLHQSSDPNEDVAIIDQLLTEYRYVFKENPVGPRNADIVATLRGDNPKNIFFLAPDHPSINSSGELIDRWGEPYVFHSLTDTVMDVRSPGPDRKPWTEDDLFLHPPELE